MSGLSLIQNRAIRRLFANQCLSKVALAINAASAATIKTTGTTTYAIEGIAYSKAALAAQSFAVTHSFQGGSVALQTEAQAYVQPQQTTVVYVVALDAAGNVAIIQGSYAGQQITFPLDISKVITGVGGVPFVATTMVPIGAVKITTAAATTFTPGTTALDAAGITAVYTDIIVLPETL